MSTNVEGQFVSPNDAKTYVRLSGFCIGDKTQFGIIIYLSEHNGMAEVQSNDKELYYDYYSKSCKFRSLFYHVKIWRLRHCG